MELPGGRNRVTVPVFAPDDPGSVVLLLFLFFAFFAPSPSASAQERWSAPAPEAGANLPARPLEAGDLAAIVVYGAPELSRTVRGKEGAPARLILVSKTHGFKT